MPVINGGGGNPSDTAPAFSGGENFTTAPNAGANNFANSGMGAQYASITQGIRQANEQRIAGLNAEAAGQSQSAKDQGWAASNFADAQLGRIGGFEGSYRIGLQNSISDRTEKNIRSINLAKEQAIGQGNVEMASKLGELGLQQMKLIADLQQQAFENTRNQKNDFLNEQQRGVTNQLNRDQFGLQTKQYETGKDEFGKRLGLDWYNAQTSRSSSMKGSYSIEDSGQYDSWGTPIKRVFDKSTGRFLEDNEIQTGFYPTSNTITQFKDKTSGDVADAIKEIESKGKFSARGGSGEGGAYQFMPSTWKNFSSQYAAANGINRTMDFTKENEDLVARWKIDKWIRGGFSPEEAALKWNGGELSIPKPLPPAKDSYGFSLFGGPNLTGVFKKGTNKQGQEYNTETYLNKFKAALDNQSKVSGDTTKPVLEVAPIKQEDLIPTIQETTKRIANNIPAAYKQSSIGVIKQLAENGDVAGAKEAILQTAKEFSKGTNVAGKALIGSTREQIALLVSVDNMMNDMKKAGVNTGFMKGNVENIARIFGNTTDPKLVQFQARAQQLLSKYIVSMSGVQFSNKEREMYMKSFPNTTYFSSINETLIKQLVGSLNNQIDTFYKDELGTTNYNKLFPGGASAFWASQDESIANGVTVTPEQNQLRSKYNY